MSLPPALTGQRLWLAGLVLGLLAVVGARPATEGRAALARGIAAEARGDFDAARLAYGEARLWRLPLFSHAQMADARLAALTGGRPALAGQVPAHPAWGASPFGQAPHPGLALLGGLALVAGLAAAARWALTARPLWGGVTVLGAVVAALALGAA